MAKLVSEPRSHEPLEYAPNEDRQAESSTASNIFGIALIALCVLGAVALMLATLRV